MDFEVEVIRPRGKPNKTCHRKRL